MNSHDCNFNSWSLWKENQGKPSLSVSNNPTSKSGLHSYCISSADRHKQYDKLVVTNSQ